MTFSTKLTLIVAFFILSSTASSRTANADISIDNYSNASNDRFTNDPSFILDGFDLSGIGQDATGRWATAISRNVVISASHLAPNGAISFYPGNDATATPVIRNVVSGMKIGSTDLYVAVLDAALPGLIASYQFAREALNVPAPETEPPFGVNSAGSFDGLTAFLFGRSPLVQNAWHDQAVGQNIISGYSENTPFEGNTDNDSIIFAKDSPGDPDYVPFEAKFAGGDSGGPTFVIQGGALVLLGTNAFIYDPTDFTIGGTGSGINYTGNQATAIDAFVALHAVPEPSSGLLLTLGLAVFVGRRRSPA
jgi:hypothetical protein